MEFIWIMLGGLVLSAIIGASVKAPGNALASKFAQAGTLTGKTKSQIIAIVGPPSSVSGLPDGKTVVQWMATGYHIALRFDGEICEGVTHEFKA